MRMLTLVAHSLLLAVPGTALAAPPANDNRAAAEAIPAFPHTLAATTAEATVERLDPQVSRCGRIESTLWYRIDTAPDGLIALTVKGAAGVAPVLRIYRRTASAIQEVDCASAGPGGSASASLEAVRGSSYLVLVGRRPSTPDGGFELRARAVPAARRTTTAPAPRRSKLPGSVRGTTLGATGDEADPAVAASRGDRLVPATEPPGRTHPAPAHGRRAARRARSSCSSGFRSQTSTSRAAPPTAAATATVVVRLGAGCDLSDRRRSRPKRRSRHVPDRRARLRGGREPEGGEAPASRGRPRSSRRTGSRT